MKEEELTALAREYAEEATKADAGDPNLSDSDLKGIRRDVAEYAEEVIRFLSHRFYLVEKEAVRKQFECAKRLIEAHSYDKQYIGVGSRGILERLFPEIAKEVEE